MLYLNSFLRFLIAVRTLRAYKIGVKEGDGCYFQDVCNSEVSGLWCSFWEDGSYGPMMTCEKCNIDSNRYTKNSTGHEVAY